MPARELQVVDSEHLAYRVGVRLEGRGSGDEAGEAGKGWVMRAF